MYIHLPDPALRNFLRFFTPQAALSNDEAEWFPGLVSLHSTVSKTICGYTSSPREHSSRLTSSNLGMFLTCECACTGIHYSRQGMTEFPYFVNITSRLFSFGMLTKWFSPENVDIS